MKLLTFARMRFFVEHQAFGVCSRLAEKFQWPLASVRLFFIYATFLTVGSPIIIYLALAFVMDLRRQLRRRRNTVWYF